MDNKEIAQIFEHIGKLLELKGNNFFKSRAYYNAARTIAELPVSLKDVYEKGSLKQINGIGDALEKKIIELLDTGRLLYLERLESDIPRGVRELLSIHGVGPKKIRILVETLGIQSVGELEYACRENRLKDLPGFGLKSQQNILEGIEFFKRSSERVLYHEAENAVNAFISTLEKDPRVLHAVCAGDMRRHMETVAVGKIVAVVEEDCVSDVVNGFIASGSVENIEESSISIVSVHLKGGLHCELRIVCEQELPCALMYDTGSADHYEHMKRYAQKRGYILNHTKLNRGEIQLDLKDESDIYRELGMSYIPPEIREGTGEIEAAVDGTLPELIDSRDIRGLFHVHTTWSDGSNTIEEMAEAAGSMGMDYLGISDHSASARYAGGLSPDDVRRQWEEIEEYNARGGAIHVLKGIESDIHHDGSLDYDDNTLEGFEFVIASIHSWFSMTRDEATERIVHAISHPAVTMLGHPTGRLLLAREGYPIDMETVLDTCMEHGVIIELNANPHRLDLDWRHLGSVRERGLLVCINPDAHQTGTLNHVHYGVNIARKGWLTKTDVLNTLPFEKICKRLKKQP